MPPTFRKAAGIVVALTLATAVWIMYVRALPIRTGSADSNLKADNESMPLIIGLSISSNREKRWAIEADIMQERAKAMGATLLTANADGDANAQEQQAKELMERGVKVLIVIPNDAERAAAIVEEAHRRDVKVIAYDRLIRNADLDYYLTFDSYRVGELQASGVLAAAGAKGNFAYIGGSPTDNNAAVVRKGSFSALQPKIDSGDIRIVLDQDIPDWDADIAYRTVSGFLKKGGKIDAAVVANDGMAGGVIRALAEHGLAGKVPVSGQDAELRAVQDIVKGTQTVTVYKPLPKLAEEAVNMAVAAAKQEQLKINSTVDNGKIFVPARLLNVIMVTKENLDSTVILDGFHSREDVYGK